MALDLGEGTNTRPIPALWRSSGPIEAGEDLIESVDAAKGKACGWRRRSRE
jgi:hypothetical protein